LLDCSVWGSAVWRRLGARQSSPVGRNVEAIEYRAVVQYCLES
jgi:hypothetical protein